MGFLGMAKLKRSEQQATECATNIEIRITRELEEKYSHIIPVVVGRGLWSSTVSLLGRRRSDQSKIEEILSQPCGLHDSLTLVWESKLPVSGE